MDNQEENVEFTATEREPVPAGDYLCQLESVTWGVTKFGKKPLWVFEVKKPEEYAGQTLRGWTTSSTDVGSKFCEWATALLGRPIKKGDRVSSKDLIGHQAVVEVEVRTAEDGKRFNRIEKVRPYKKAGSAQQAQPEPSADEGHFPDEEPDFNEDPFA